MLGPSALSCLVGQAQQPLRHGIQGGLLLPSFQELVVGALEHLELLALALDCVQETHQSWKIAYLHTAHVLSAL